MPDNTDGCAKRQRRSIGARRNPATEAAILDAAEKLLHDKGVRGLTMEAVARAARAGKATLYKWYPSRGALLVAVYERSKGEHRHSDKGDLIQSVTAFYRFVFEFWKTPEGQLFPLIIAEAQSDPDVANALERYRGERLAALEEAVGWSAARGELVAGATPKALAEIIMAAAWLRLLTGRLETDPADLAREVLSAWVVGKV